MKHSSPAILAGLVGGALFFGHAMINNSHAWPMVWPLLAGSAAVLLAARRHGLQGFWNGLGLAARAGLVAGSLFFVMTLAALALLATAPFEATATALGAEGPVVLTASVVIALAAAALGGTMLAALAGAATFPIVGRRH